MRRTALMLGILALGALAGPPPARALDVIDDWRKVGPPDDNDPPHSKGELSPAAAERLVAEIDEAWRSGRPLRARGDSLEWVVDNLRYAFLPASGLPAPRTMGPREEIEKSRDLIRRIDLLGRRPANAHELLLVVAHVNYGIYSETFDPVALAVVLRSDGSVRDLAVLDHRFGDACQSEHREYRVEPKGVRYSHEDGFEGTLCAEASLDDECCSVSEGSTTDLSVGPDGRFEAKVHRLNLSGQFVDDGTGEEIRIEDGGRSVRVGYRARAKAPWKALTILSSDRKLGVLVVKFEKSSIRYTLTIPEDGRSLVSAGSDGSKPQRFGWIGLQERWRRDGNR